MRQKKEISVKISNGMLMNGRNRCGVQITAKPWAAGVPEELIKVRCKKAIGFPAWVRHSLDVENNSNGREDYFEKDVIRLMPGDPLYDQAKAAA